MLRDLPQGARPKHARRPLEAELAAALARIQDSRDRKLIARYLGWDGRPPCSLSQAGVKFQITRERARQIYSNAIPTLSRYLPAPILEKAFDFIARRQYQSVSQVEQDLQRRGLTGGDVSVAGITRAAQVFGRNPGFSLHLIGKVWFVCPDPRVIQAILEEAVSAVAHLGAVRLSDVSRRASRSLGSPARRSIVRNVLETRPDLCWLDQKHEWLWLSEVRRNRLLPRVQKVLVTCSRIALSQLVGAVSREHQSLRIPEPVLRSICARISWCRVAGGFVEARNVPASENVLTGAEAVICGILRQSGGAMRLAQLNERCREAGIQRPNQWRILRFSPAICRFGPEWYGLIGTSRPLRARERQAA